MPASSSQVVHQPGLIKLLRDNILAGATAWWIILAIIVPAVLTGCGQNSNAEQAAANKTNREGNSVVISSAEQQELPVHSPLSRGNPDLRSFGPLIAWPLVPIHAALTPDGRLMTFGRDPDAASEMIYDVWDWQQADEQAAHLTLPNSLGTDLFCSNQLLLSNGQMLMAGGDLRESVYPGQVGTQLLRGNQDANLFDPENNRLTRSGRLTEPRWYASLTMLPWGEVYVQGGALDMNLNIAARHAEIASEDGRQYRALSGFELNDLPWYYPRNFTDRHGTIVGWAHNYSYRIDPRGDGVRVNTGQAPGVILNNGSMAVMYAPGKVLLAGGGSRQAVRADINGEVPAYETVPPMNSPRLWGTATVLPDGKVLVSNGGTSDTSIVDAPLGEPALQVMLYNPETNQWAPGATAQKPRLYHSTSILLPDGTVLMGGGGLPGPVTNLNAELYYPPYLFAPDGTFAIRPEIKSVTPVIAPASSLTIEVDSSAGVSRIVLIKTGAVTHSFDMDQRFVELPVRPVTGAGTHQIATSLPTDPAATPPGYYHLFVINEDGVPSISKILRMTAYQGQLPSTPKPAIQRPALGTTEGSKSHLLACARNEHLVGAHGSYSAWVRTLGPICRSTDGIHQSVVMRAENAPAIRDGTHQLFELQCDAGQFAQGFRVQLSGDQTRILGLTLDCASSTGAPGATPSIGQLDLNTAGISETCKTPLATAGLALFYDDSGATALATRCQD